MPFGKLTVICGLALEAWLMVFTLVAGLRVLAMTLAG